MNLAVLALRIDRNAGRVKAIVSVLARYGLAQWLGGLKYDWLQGMLLSSDGQKLGALSTEARIRLALTELGPTFIKLGQVVSTRPDLVGQALVDELAHLQDDTPPDPPEVVRATVAIELGKPVDELFAYFDDKALASASIGQVHRARLVDGQDVVVKVQHAGIQEKVAIDLELLAGLAVLAEKDVANLRSYQPVALVREFRRVLLRELDFGSERRNLERFALDFADDEAVHFPAVFPALCSRRVLTMEYLDGVKGTDAVGLRQTGVDLGEFARRAADMYLKMIFRDGFFHADPHPGNYILLPGGVVGVLDCGMVGRIDDDLREQVESMVLAIIDGDAAELTDVVIRLCATPIDLDREVLRAEVAEFYGEYTGQALQDLDLGAAINQLIDIIRRHRLILPSSCSLLLRTIVMLEGICRQLSPDFNLLEFLQPYQTQLLKRRLSPRRLLNKLQRVYRDWDRLLTALPRDVADILARVRNGTFEVKHEHHRLEITMNRLAQGILSAALFLGSTQLLGRGGDASGWGLNALGCAFLVMAAWLGYRVVRAVDKSDQS